MPVAQLSSSKVACRAIAALTLTIAAVAVAPAAPAAASDPSPCANTQLIPAAGNLQVVAAATLCLVNQQRAAYGVAPLGQNATLTSAAVAHSQDMVNNSYFSHTSPSGSDPLSRIRAAGYLRPGVLYTIGENIAAATGGGSTPEAGVDMWMNSPGHRDNILSSSFRDTGIGVAAGAPFLGPGPGGTYTEDFGARG